MADTSIHTSTGFNFIAGLERFWSGLASSMETLAKTQSRVRQMEALSNLSDDQLAQRGMKREDIARHVFRDVYYV